MGREGRMNRWDRVLQVAAIAVIGFCVLTGGRYNRALVKDGTRLKKKAVPMTVGLTPQLLEAVAEYQQSGPTVHVVKAGETLEDVADEYDVDVDDLLEFNEGLREDNVYTGLRIKIPEMETDSEAEDDDDE